MFIQISIFCLSGSQLIIRTETQTVLYFFFLLIYYFFLALFTFYLWMFLWFLFNGPCLITLLTVETIFERGLWWNLGQQLLWWGHLCLVGSLKESQYQITWNLKVCSLTYQVFIIRICPSWHIAWAHAHSMTSTGSLLLHHHKPSCSITHHRHTTCMCMHAWWWWWCNKRGIHCLTSL